MKNLLLLSGLVFLLSNCYDNQNADFNGYAFKFEGYWCVNEIVKISTNKPHPSAAFLALAKTKMEIRIDSVSIRLIIRDKQNMDSGKMEDDDVLFYKKKSYSEETLYIDMETGDEKKLSGEISASKNGIMLKIEEMDIAYDLIKCR